MVSSSGNLLEEEEELDTLLPTNINALGLSKRALVGKLLFTGKQQQQLNINAVKETLYKSWSNYEQLHISEKDKNTFLFCFKKEEHATEVMLKSPWYVMNHLLCLQYWLPEVSVTELDFDRNPFWVQVHNLPLENLNKLSAAILLEKVGEVMEIEEPIIEGKIVRHFVRGRVQVDVTKPLPTGCWIPRVSLPKLWVSFRYEKLQDLCFNCGILGHERRDCEKARVMTYFNPNLPKYHELSVQASKSVAEIVRGFENKTGRRTDTPPQQHQEEVRDENTQTKVERLKKEQEEKEHKEKEKAEAHLYTIIKVAQDEDLAEQIGKDTYFDLVDHDKVWSFLVQKQMSFNNFKEVVAKEFDVEVQFQRFWLWAKRQNHTYRPNRPLTPIEEALSVGQLREVAKNVQNAELKLFLEVERGADLRPITPPEKKKDEILLFFKLYDPENEELRYVGRLFVNSTSQPSEYLPRLNEMAGYDSDEEIRLYEEIKFEPKVMCEPIDKKLTFRASQLEDGDIICFQKASAMDIEEHIRYPDVPSYLEYVHNRQVVHFRSLDKPKEDDFCLEMSRLFIYDDVVERVAQQLGLEDPSKIRLTPHNCYSRQPKAQPIKYRGVDHLSDMLVHYNQTSDILYYEVLDIPLPELQGLKTLKVAFHHATKDEVVIHSIRLPKQSTVGDVLDDLKTKVELSHPQAELRLLEVFNHKIYQVFARNEKIENINDQYWTLRAEEIPEEEKNLGSHDSLIHVYHFTKDTTQNQMHIQNFGEPFRLVIHECETLAEIKVRIQKKLQVPDDEFAKWKFAVVSLGRPEYLQDSDIVSSRFQRRDLYGAWEQYLGLEHT